jgi:tetratricopeptide (TPR) repeat protein
MAAGSSRDLSSETLVGRTSELRQLADCLARARQGRGSIAVVSGEAGVGKSALVRQLQRQALCLTGYCHEFSAAPPYGPWLEILGEINLMQGDQGSPAPDIRDGSALQALAPRILSSVEAIDGGAPVVLILEDLHWADDATLDLLRIVARRVESHAVLLLVTYRSDDLHLNSSLGRLLPFLLRETGAERIHLERLTPDLTAELVNRRYDPSSEQASQLAAYLQSRAQGNPFFTLELLYTLEEHGYLVQEGTAWTLRHLDDMYARPPLPDLVRYVIGMRLERLDGHTRRLLQVAAVIGQRFQPTLWQSLADVDEHLFTRSVQRAIGSHFLEESPGGTLRFRHALVREVIYLNVVLPERQRLHRLAAEAEQAATSPDPDRVAYHFAQAMDPRAVEWLADAGKHALAVAAPRVAIEHCNLALELERTLRQPVPLDVYLTRGNAWSLAGEFQLARSDLGTLLARARQAGDRRMEWQALHDLGQLWAAQDYSRTHQHVTEALSLAREIADDELIAHSLSQLGTWYLNDNRPGAAIQRHETALSMFRERHDPAGIAATTDLLGMDYLIIGNMDRAERYMSEAISAFEALDDRPALCTVLASYVVTGGTQGFEQEPPARLRRSIDDVMERALSLARELHWKNGESYAYCSFGAWFATRGRYGEAIDSLNTGLSIAREIEHHEWEAYSLDNLADVYLKLLHPERSEDLSRQSIEAALRSNSSIHLKAARTTLAANLIERGEIEAGLDLLDLSLETDPSVDTADRRLQCNWLVRALLAMGDAKRALNVIARVAARTGDSGERTTPWTSRLLGQAQHAAGMHDQAEASLRASISLAEDLGYLPALWQGWLSLGSLYTSLRRPGDARTSFDQARDAIERITSSLTDVNEQERFRTTALGQLPGGSSLTPFQEAKLRAGGLTPRQRDVAILVARGWTNAAIAGELHISERTVEGHVSAIMIALDFSSRAQIAAWAVDQRLTSLQEPSPG